MTGETISHYAVGEKLGEGGMGVVFKARDTKLDRDVALKFLPDRTVGSEADKARFIQEAKAASALNHPNVCTIHDIQEHDGRLFLVMEFIDGQTLRDRMPSMTHRQAIEIGIQVADGLSAAHEKGIVHRDVKPENIMIRKDGIAQIMDFGLAKLRASSSKITRLTREGSTVGTAGYMSPEQVQGHDADHRSDIFSLGVLLYELFTGRLPFNGVHETALSYEIVNVDPAPMSVVRPDLDPSLDAVVLECMEKDPNERTQSAKQVSVDLRRYKRESSRQRASRITAARPIAPAAGGYAGAASTIGGPPMPGTTVSGIALPAGGASGEFPVTQTGAVAGSTAGSRAGRASKLPWVLAGLFLLTTAGALFYHAIDRPAPEPKRLVWATIGPPPGVEFNASQGGQLAISPDGRAIAFVATDSAGANYLWVRPVASPTAVQLAGTKDAWYPFWSYDSRTVAFFSQGKMRKIDAAGGPVLTICDAPEGRGGTWNAAGVIVFSPDATGLLWKVPAAGGTATPITQIDTTVVRVNNRWPHFLPDGNHFIYTTQSSVGGLAEDSVRIGTLDGSMDRVLFIGNTNVEYASGYLLYHRQSMLMAQPFDTATLSVTGEAVPLAENLLYSSFRNRANFSISRGGVIVLQGGTEAVRGQMAILDARGNVLQTVDLRNVAGGRFSNDGTRIVAGTRDDQARSADLWVRDIASGRNSRFTFNPAVERSGFWSPSDDSIVFSSPRGRWSDLYIKHANGTDAEELLLGSEQDKFVTDWSRDGRLIAFITTGDMRTKTDLWLLPMHGDRKPIQFLHSEFREGNGSFSPDANWIAYPSDETTRFEIYVRRVDGSAGKWQISIDGGQLPIWSKDGKTIWFQSPDRRMLAASVRIVNSSVIVDSIQTLFDLDSRRILNNVSDVSRDGKRMLAILGDARQIAPPVTMIVNWEELLKTQGLRGDADGR